MTTINTTEDLLSLLHENQEFREAVRQAILTEELLALPAVFTAVASEIRADIRELHGLFRRQHDDLGRFRGNYAADAARKNDLEIAQLFARTHRMRRIRRRRLTPDELSSMLNENYEILEALGLRERAWLTFENADIIAEVTERSGVSQGFYIAVEASFTGNLEDVRRASDHAKILRHATGQDAYAIVASVRVAPNIENSIFEDVAAFIKATDENAALWYRLYEDEMEPRDPH